MGMDFNVDVNVKTNGKEAIDALERQLNKLKSETVKINVQATGDGADFAKYFSSIQKQAQSAGKGIGISLQQGIKSVKFNGNSKDYFTQYFEQQKKNMQEAKNVSKQYDVSQKNALKAVNARNSAAVKANNEAIKEQKRQQKEIEAIESARIKSIENAKKREEQATLAQNKAINKSLEDSYRKRQQEQQKSNAQNLAQIRTVEESQKRIQVQQQIAAMKANAIQKNAHNNLLVQQGKNNIIKWQQEYENQSKYLQKIESAQTKITNLKSTVSNNSSLLGSSGYDKITSQIKQAEQATQRFNAELQKGKNANLDNLKSDLKEIGTLTQKSTKEYQKLTSISSERDQQNLLNKLKKYEQDNARAIKAGQSTWNSIINDASGGNITTGQMQDIESRFKSFNLQMQAAGKTGKSFWQEMGRGFKQIAQFAGTYGMIQRIPQEIGKMYQETVKVNSAQIELAKVSDAPTSQLTKYWDEAVISAKKYSSTISDVISNTADWSRLGYKLEDAKKLSDATTLLQKVGDNMTQESSSKGLISTLQGFRMEADQVTSIIDKINQVSNTQPIDSAGLFAGLERSASSMSAANNSLEQTIALITAANSVVQDPESVGTAFKTKFLRNCLYVQKCA